MTAGAAKSPSKAKPGGKGRRKGQQKQPGEKQQQQQKPDKKKEPSRVGEKSKDKDKTRATKTKKSLKVAPAKQGGHCVLLSHLPPGLREPQLRRFVGQFGRVLRLRVPRSARTGSAKGVAFVELANPAAARAVADTLDNYLMFARLLRCKVVPDPKRLTFAADGRRRRKAKATPASAADAPASEASAAAAAGNSRRSQRRLQAKVDRLKRLNPSYELKLTDD